MVLNCHLFRVSVISVAFRMSLSGEFDGSRSAGMLRIFFYLFFHMAKWKFLGTFFAI